MAETGKAGKKPVVVVLGMGRSGTSLGMSVLAALGVSCGDNLIPAGRDNPEGFWEQKDIAVQHERLLLSLNRVWHGPTGTWPMPEDWLDSRAARTAVANLSDIVSRELDAAGNAVWGFKDPRTARLIPLWQRVFDKLELAPRYLLMVRHPKAVAESLVLHNGVTAARAQLIWLTQTLGALGGSAKDLRLVIDFDRLIGDPAREVERITSAFDDVLDPSAKTRADAAARIAPKLRTHDRTDQPLEVPLVRRTYEMLQMMASDETPNEHPLSILSEYAASSELFAPWHQDRRPLLWDWFARGVLWRVVR